MELTRKLAKTTGWFETGKRAQFVYAYVPSTRYSISDVPTLPLIPSYSWGPMWGEDGYIRLKRTNPSVLEDPASDCKMDVTPTDGIACTKDDSGNDIVPKAVSVCGTAGILFDTVVPIGAHLA